MTEQVICTVSDLAKDSGICALLNVKGQEQQAAIFYLPNTEKKIYAVGNWDPIGEANVISRGMVGSIGKELVVASPLYKQHFSLLSGNCLEEDHSLPVYDVVIDGDKVVVTA